MEVAMLQFKLCMLLLTHDWAARKSNKIATFFWHFTARWASEKANEKSKKKEKKIPKKEQQIESGRQTETKGYLIYHDDGCSGGLSKTNLE